jgi:hypothetical protein
MQITQLEAKKKKDKGSKKIQKGSVLWYQHPQTSKEGLKQHKLSSLAKAKALRRPLRMF